MLAVGGMEEPAREPLFYHVLPPRYNPFPGTNQGPITRIWDVVSRTQLAAFPRCVVAFSPDGKVLAALCDDQVIDLCACRSESRCIAYSFGLRCYGWRLYVRDG